MFSAHNIQNFEAIPIATTYWLHGNTDQSSPRLDPTEILEKDWVGALFFVKKKKSIDLDYGLYVE